MRMRWFIWLLAQISCVAVAEITVAYFNGGRNYVTLFGSLVPLGTIGWFALLGHFLLNKWSAEHVPASLGYWVVETATSTYAFVRVLFGVFLPYLPRFPWQDLALFTPDQALLLATTVVLGWDAVWNQLHNLWRVAKRLWAGAPLPPAPAPTFAEPAPAGSAFVRFVVASALIVVGIGIAVATGIVEFKHVDVEQLRERARAAAIALRDLPVPQIQIGPAQRQPPTQRPPAVQPPAPPPPPAVQQPPAPPAPVQPPAQQQPRQGCSIPPNSMGVCN